MINIQTVEELARVVEGKLSLPPFSLSPHPVSSISIDTRTLVPGQCYLALTGENHDGHDFIAAAIAAGAAAFIADRAVVAAVPVVVVQDTLAALTKLGQTLRQAFTHPVIAITGSCGKTTVKEMCRLIFQEAGNTLCPQKSYNNHIGLPLTLCQLEAKHDFAILELGTNHPGEIAQLVALAQPNVAVVNNVGPAHLQGFKTLLGVAKEKGSIYEGLVAGGVAVINLDDDYASMYQEQCHDRQCLTFSIRQQADVTATDIHFDSDARASFQLQTPQGTSLVQLPLPGAHQVSNALAAASCAVAAGVPLTAISVGLQNMTAIPGRWKAHHDVYGATLIDDSYNANPKSVLAALKCLQQLPGEHWFVLGDMGELGPNAEKMHEEIGQAAKTLGIQRLFSVGTLAYQAQQAFGEGGQHFNDKAELIQFLQTALHKNVTLVVKGSLSSKMGMIVEALRK